MVGAGCTVSPPIFLIRIHTGWVMGEVKDSYFSGIVQWVNMLAGALLGKIIWIILCSHSVLFWLK